MKPTFNIQDDSSEIVIIRLVKARFWNKDYILWIHFQCSCCFYVGGKLILWTTLIIIFEDAKICSEKHLMEYGRIKFQKYLIVQLNFLHLDFFICLLSTDKYKRHSRAICYIRIWPRLGVHRWCWPDRWRRGQKWAGDTTGTLGSQKFDQTVIKLISGCSL